MSAAVEARLRDDFRAFLWVLWEHLSLPEPTPIQYDIGEFLQNGPARRVIEAFRGVGKSWLTAAFVLWRLYRNPEERVLVVSANEERAGQFTTFCRRLIDEVAILRWLRPRDGQRDSTLSFDVGPASAHQSPSLRAAGIFGQITGGRASLIVADDVEVPKNSLTQVMRDRLAEAIKEFDAVLSPGGEIVYLGTPQTEGSIYNLLPSRGYAIRIWPARYPAKQERYSGRIAPWMTKRLARNPSLVGKPTEPTRFSEQELVERELSYGRAGFSLQFMLDTTMSDVEKYPLKLRDAIAMALNAEMAPAKVVYAADPRYVYSDLPAVGLAGDRWYGPAYTTESDWLPYQGVVMAVDPSGRGGDELAYAVVAMLHGFLYVLDVKGLRGGPTDANLQAIAEAAKQWKVKLIRVEENFGDGMFTQLLTPHLTRIYPVTTEEVKHSIQKELRICDTLEPLLLQHRLIFNLDLIRRDAENYNDYPADHAHRYQLFYQLTRITRDRQALGKDDRLDVLAMACGYWVLSMAKDTARIEEDLKLKAADKALKDFLAKAKGLTGKPSYTTSITGRRTPDGRQRGVLRWSPGKG